MAKIVNNFSDTGKQLAFYSFLLTMVMHEFVNLSLLILNSAGLY